MILAHEQDVTEWCRQKCISVYFCLQPHLYVKYENTMKICTMEI